MQQTDTDERWYVQFDSGEVRLMTLEELDGAFEAGEVHENTYVIQVGETQWQTLSDVAGLDDGEEEPADPAPPAAAPTPVYAAPAYAQPAAAPAYPQPQAAPAYAQPQRAPVAQAASARPVVAAAAGGWPPVATPAKAPQSSWPPAATSVSNSGYNLGPQSTIPVVNDVDLDFDGRSFKSGRRTALIAAFAALPVLGGGIYGLTRLDTPSETPVVAAAAPAPVQTASKWSGSAALEATPAPAAPAPTPTEPKADSGSTGRLSEDMRKALLASDSTRTPKQKARSTAPARRAASSGKKGGEGSGFKAGGSTNDPLNSKL